MRLLFTSFILIFTSSFCSGQASETTDAYPSSFVLGVSVHQMLSSSREVRRYSLNTIEDGEYTDISNKHRSSPLLKVTGEFQFTYWYVRGGLGIRTERTNFEAHNIQEYYNFAPGQSYNAEVYRGLHINEKTTSLMLSIEAGSYFRRRDHPLRFGMGAGFDFCKYLDSKSTGLTQLNKEERIIQSSFPEIHEVIESTHSKGSEDWETVVRDVSMPLVIPKISLKASYRIYDNFSLSVQARMRLLVLKPEARNATTLLEFPVGIGFHYHFLN